MQGCKGLILQLFKVFIYMQLYYLHISFQHTFQPVWTEWGQYSTDMFTERAIDIIKKHDPSKPLFLYLPYQAVHSANYIQPIQAPPDEIKKFSHIKDENRRIFAAVVSVLDQRVGQVHTTLVLFILSCFLSCFDFSYFFLFD